MGTSDLLRDFQASELADDPRFQVILDRVREVRSEPVHLALHGRTDLRSPRPLLVRIRHELVVTQVLRDLLARRGSVLNPVLFVAFAGPIVRIFTADPGVAQVGETALRIISYGYVLYAWGMVILQAFNGAGETWTPTWVNLIAFWLVQIPLAWVLAHVVGIGHEGVYWAIAASYSLSAVIGLVLFRRGKWKLKQVS